MELHQVDPVEFREEGFTVVRSAFDAEELKLLRRRLDEVIVDLGVHEARVTEAHRPAEWAYPMEGAPDVTSHLVEQQRRLPELPETAVGTGTYVGKIACILGVATLLCPS